MKLHLVLLALCVDLATALPTPTPALHSLPPKTGSLSESRAAENEQKLPSRQINHGEPVAPPSESEDRTKRQLPAPLPLAPLPGTLPLAPLPGVLPQAPLPGAVAPVPAVSSPGAAVCLGLLPPPNAELRYSMNDPVGPFNSGSTATVVCNGGSFPIVAAGQTTVTTCQNGQWMPSPLSLASCSAPVLGR